MKTSMTQRLLASVLALAVVLGALVILPLSAAATDVGSYTVSGINGEAGTFVVPEANLTRPTPSVNFETDTEYSVYGGVNSEVAPTEVDAEGYTLITSAAEFGYVIRTAGFGDTAGNKYRLTTGIDLNKTFPFNTFSFAAELDGAGHTIKNIKGHLGGDAAAGKPCGFFNTVSGTVKNMVLTDVAVGCDAWRRPYAAALVGTLSNGGVVDGIIARTGTVKGTNTGNIVASIAPGVDGEATVKNCVVEETFTASLAENADGGQIYGGIVCMAGAGHAIIENCFNYAVVVKKADTGIIYDFSTQNSQSVQFGGILGNGSTSANAKQTVKNCYNMADIVTPRTTGQYTRSNICGGIIGLGGVSDITGCVNYGNIKTNADYSTSVGGVVGKLISSNASNENPKVYDLTAELNDCSNYGTVEGKAERIAIGGIIGSTGSKTGVVTLKNAYNYGVLKIRVKPAAYGNYMGTSFEREFDIFVGGLVGETELPDWQSCYTNVVVENGGNVGTIDFLASTQNTFTVAKPSDATEEITPIAVTLSVKLNLNVGGILGRGMRNVTFKNVSNTSDVKMELDRTPSVITPVEGVEVTSVTEKVNFESAYFGGLLGRTYSATDSSFINCRNTGDVTALPGATKTYAGGLAGQSSGSGTLVIQDSVNTGNVDAISEGEAGGGGLSGSCAGMSVSLVNSVNLGDVNTSGKPSSDGKIYVRAAGLIPLVNAVVELTNCANYGDVVLSGETTNIGGLISEMTGALVAENSVNYGNLTLNYTPAVGTVSATTTVTRTPSFFAGGIVGKVAGNATLNSCAGHGVLTLNINFDYKVPTKLPAGAETAAITINTKTTNTLYAGGAVGHVTGAVNITNYVNKNDIVINQDTISNVEILEAEGVTGTVGTGAFESTSYVGGMVGKVDVKTVGVYSTYTNCQNYGAITAPGPQKAYAAGIVAYTENGVVLNNCANYGEVTAVGKTVAIAGGFVGICPASARQVDLIFNNSSNHGDINLEEYTMVKNTHPNGRAGGFVGSMGEAGGDKGYVDIHATGCAQYGNVFAALGDAGAASVLGYTNIGHGSPVSGAQIELFDCYIVGTVAGGSGSGGVLGYHNPSDYPNGARHVDIIIKNSVIAPTLMTHINNGKGGSGASGGEGILIGFSFKTGGSYNDTFTAVNSYLKVTDTQPINYNKTAYGVNEVKNFVYDVYTDDMLTNGTVMTTLNSYAVANAGVSPWAFADGKPIQLVALGLTGANMSLSGTMKLNMKLDLVELENLLGMTEVSVALADATGTCTDAVMEDDYFTVAYDTFAYDMAKEMELYLVFTVGADNFASHNVTTYSALQYAMNTYHHYKDTNAELTDLVVKMMNYGAKAEAKRYGTSVIADTVVANGIPTPVGEFPTVGSYTSPDVTEEDKANLNAIALTAASLSGSVDIGFVMTNEAYTTLTVDNKTYTKENGVILFSGINASNIKRTYFLTFSGEGVADVTVNFAVGNFLESNRGDAEAKDLVEATILYMLAARTYAFMYN